MPETQRLSPLADGPHGARPVAVITGAAKRLGRYIALALAETLNLDVIVHYGRSEKAAADVVQEVRSLGRKSMAISADLSDPERAAIRIFDAATALGNPTVLINSAAVFADRSLSDVDVPHCEQHFLVNTIAPVFLTQALAHQIDQTRSGHVINILDWRATRPPESHLIYSASKAALASVTRTLAQQLASQIQVNAIAPGAILPPPDQPNWHAERAATDIPIGHPGAPSDITDTIIFLLRSSFITGEIIHVDGGEQL